MRGITFATALIVTVMGSLKAKVDLLSFEVNRHGHRLSQGKQL